MTWSGFFNQSLNFATPTLWNIINNSMHTRPYMSSTSCKTHKCNKTLSIKSCMTKISVESFLSIVFWMDELFYVSYSVALNVSWLDCFHIRFMASQWYPLILLFDIWVFIHRNMLQTTSVFSFFNQSFEVDVMPYDALPLRYRRTSNIRCTKSQSLTNVSHFILQLSLPNPLKPCVKSRMKM